MEKKFISIWYVLGLIILVVGIVLCSWALLGSISDDRRGSSEVGASISTAREEQRQAREIAESVGKRLEQSEAFVESVRKFHNEATGGIEIVQNRNAETAAIIRENRELIAEGRSVIDDLRKRGKADTEAK